MLNKAGHPLRDDALGGHADYLQQALLFSTPFLAIDLTPLPATTLAAS